LDRDAQVKPWLQFAGTDTTHDAILDVIIAGVCARAAKLHGGPILPTTYGPDDGLGKFDGSGGLNSGYIMLPRRPVIQVVEVVEYQGQSPVVLPEVTDPFTGADGFQVNYRSGRITRVLGGLWNRPFYPGSNNVWITWVAGYNPIDPDWIQAALEWVAFVFRNTQQTLSAKAGLSLSQEYDPSDATDILYRGVPARITSVFTSNSAIGIR
jgi:hypothetical protein